MAAFADTFRTIAAHPDVAPLARDGRAAVAFDRTGARVLWANAAGLAALGRRGAAGLDAPAPAATRARIAMLAGRLTETPRIERVPLPVGVVPVQAASAARRLAVAGERLVLIVVIDGTAALPPGEAAARYDAILAALAPAADAAPGPATTAPAEAEPAQAAVAPGAEAETEVVASDSPAEPLEAAPPSAEAVPEAEAAPPSAETVPDAEAAPPVAEAVPEAEAAPPVAEGLHEAEPETPPSPAPSVGAGSAAPFAFPADGRTVRFVFELDPALAFTFVSPEFAEAVGPRAAAVEGESWAAAAARLGLDPAGRVGAALARHDTFTGLAVSWPVENAALRVPVDLAGMPVFGRDRGFRGYRGFGLARCGAAVPAEMLVGPAGAPTAPDEPPLTAGEIAAATMGVEAETDDGAPPVEIAPAPGPAPVWDDPGFAAGSALADDEDADVDGLMALDGVTEATIAAFAAVEGEADGAEPGGGGHGAEPSAPDTAAPGAEEAEADDLGTEWSPSEAEPPAEPPPLDAEDPAAPPEPGPTPADEALQDLDRPPPDEDPAAPDAQPDVGPDAWRDIADDGEIDLEWRNRGGEVIPSPIVARPVPREDRDEEAEGRHRLSRPEREAFQKIAEALGARFEDDGEEDRPPPRAAAAGAPPAPRPEPAPPAPSLDMGVLDRLPVAVAILKDGEAVSVNRAFLDLAGYPDRAALMQAGGFAEAFAGSALPRDASLPAIRRRDGVEVPVSARLHSIPWQGGVASLLVLQETAAATGRDRAASAEERVEELEAILDTATDGVLVLDDKGVVVGANRSAEALFGRDRSAIVGGALIDLLAPESHRAALDYLDGLARNGVASVLNDGREVIGRERQGGLVPLFMTVGRISTGKFCAVLRDITQWKRAEEDLVAARRSAETASSQKSDFLAKISHEIRTPLNAIIGFSEVMMEERFGPVGNERYKEYLRDIHLSGAHIMSLVNDLLDLSKIEAGKLDLAFEAVPANEVIRECVALMQPQANRERVIIRTSLSSSLPDVVADSRSLRQIVLNLLSNAIKFNTPGGQVIVSTIYEQSGEVAIRVRDTGSGMSEEDVARALEPFRQVHTTRPGRGTGLGLPLTKALVEANRAAFRIESTPGVGTLVQVVFPSTRVLAE